MNEGDRIVFEPDRVIRRKSVSEIDLTIQTLQTKLQKATAMLEDVQYGGIGACPICKGEESYGGHKEDCPLAALLREMG